MENLDEVLKDATLSGIKKLGCFGLGFYAKENHKTLNMLYDNKIIDDNSINLALVDVIKNQSVIDYDLMMRRLKTNYFTLYADHVASPEILAYAIKNKILSDKDISKIPFDHGQNSKSFVETYSKNDIISELYQKLMHPKPILYPDENTDIEHPVCNDCY